MAEDFKRFYSDLYTSTARHSPEEQTLFLHDIDFPTLTPTQTSLLEAPITTDGIEEALAHLSLSKAPGSNGLPLEFYVQFKEILTPKLWALYAHIFESATLPVSLVEALVILKPKPGKDLLFPGCYRPISLLQLDVKNLAKILALRLNKVILSLIHPDHPVHAQQEYSIQSP